ncbi:Translin [Thozetella sp. PMI_491]|nr:Translin [Thozetella sp. PMI_491]
MAGFKRDRDGNARKFDGPKKAPKPVAVNAFTPMFETFRDELDEHHDRRQRISQASRDITGLSKKIIFSLQRVREISPELPGGIEAEIKSRLAEISKLLHLVALETQGIKRFRYVRNLSCMEELVEALTFAHYLKNQELIGYDELVLAIAELAQRGKPEDVDMVDVDNDGSSQEQVALGHAETAEPPTISITEDDYLYGVFDLTGEMMRFATTTSALTGSMARASDVDGGDGRTILQDMQDLGSLFEMLPQRRENTWEKKAEVLRQSVRKVERLGYDRTVRGAERPAGWVPDMNTGDEQAADQVGE